MSEWKVLAVLSLVALSGCSDMSAWDEVRNSPEQNVHDKRVCVDGGMDYATNAYGEVRCIHPTTGATP